MNIHQISLIVTMIIIFYYFLIVWRSMRLLYKILLQINIFGFADFICLLLLLLFWCFPFIGLMLQDILVKRLSFDGDVIEYFQKYIIGNVWYRLFFYFTSCIVCVSHDSKEFFYSFLYYSLYLSVMVSVILFLLFGFIVIYRTMYVSWKLMRGVRGMLFSLINILSLLLPLYGIDIMKFIARYHFDAEEDAGILSYFDIYFVKSRSFNLFFYSYSYLMIPILFNI